MRVHDCSADFPQLSRRINGKPLVYLDSAATSLKPKAVIAAISDYYQQHVANVHRGVHTLSDESTQLFEGARSQVAAFVGAQPAELIFTRNATEALNGVAYGWGDAHLRPGDVVLTTQLEHHANIVPWQELCKRTGAVLKFVPVTDVGQLNWRVFEQLLDQTVKLVAVTHVSNTLGALVEIDRVVSAVHQHAPDARIVVDGAQAVPHLAINFDKFGVDFYAFSGHKMLGPMGIGGLLVRHTLLETQEMRPWLFGGGMIAEVHEASTAYHPEIADRFTAGTPDVASAIGLAAACGYLQNIGMSAVARHDAELVQYAYEQLTGISNLEVLGPKPVNESGAVQRVGSVSFMHTTIHAHDVAQVLDSEGIAVRSGHHCTMPLHEACGWQATVRASFQVYSTQSDIDALVAALAKVEKVFG